MTDPIRVSLTLEQAEIVRGESAYFSVVVENVSAEALDDVKTLNMHNRVLRLEAVSQAKRARLRRLAVQWLNAHGVRFDQVRIDVVGLVYDGTGGFSVEHIRGVG